MSQTHLGDVFFSFAPDDYMTSYTYGYYPPQGIPYQGVAREYDMYRMPPPPPYYHCAERTFDSYLPPPTNKVPWTQGEDYTEDGYEMENTGVASGPSESVGGDKENSPDTGFGSTESVSSSVHSDTELSPVEQSSTKTKEESNEDSEETKAPAAKKPKQRTSFSPEQVVVMEHHFNLKKYLSPAERQEVADLLGLTTTQVKTWFQNRRMKHKRHMKDQTSNADMFGPQNDLVMKPMSHSLDQTPNFRKSNECSGICPHARYNKVSNPVNSPNINFEHPAVKPELTPAVNHSQRWLLNEEEQRQLSPDQEYSSSYEENAVSPGYGPHQLVQQYNFSNVQHVAFQHVHQPNQSFPGVVHSYR